MIEVRVFNRECEFKGSYLQGICRWVSNNLQVEMISPFEGLVSHCHFDYDIKQLKESDVEACARKELEAIYTDVRDLAQDKEEYQWFIARNKSVRLAIARKQLALIEAHKDLELALLEGKISSKREFRMQEWLLMDALCHTENQV